jgi:hypothetical protein
MVKDVFRYKERRRPKKDEVNGYIAELASDWRRPQCLILDSAALRTSRAILQNVGACAIVVPNPASGGWKRPPRGVTTVPCDLASYLRTNECKTFDVVYLDLCGTLAKNEEAIRLALVRHTTSRRDKPGVFALTCCRRQHGGGVTCWTMMEALRSMLPWFMRLQFLLHMEYCSMATVVCHLEHKLLPHRELRCPTVEMQFRLDDGSLETNIGTILECKHPDADQDGQAYVSSRIAFQHAERWMRLYVFLYMQPGTEASWKLHSNPPK